MFWGVVVLVFILLASLAPGVAIFVAICGFFVGLFALIKGNLRWARIANRKSALVATGATILALFVAGIGLGATTEANAVTVVSSDSSIADRNLEGTLDEHLGTSCESDDLSMRQGDLEALCYATDSAELVWVSSDEHSILVAAAKEKVNEERRIAAEEAAEARAVEEARKAEEAAEASRAAEEKRVAEEKEARRAADAAEAARKAEQEAIAEEARLAEEARQAQEQADAARVAEAEREAAQKAATQPEAPAGGATFYQNCDAVRAAGAAPIYAGQPGYARKLDRDGDGIGCE